VRLPTSTNARQWSFNTTFDTKIFGRTYYRAFERRDGEIRMVRGLRVEQEEIDAAAARKDNDRIGAFDNSMARISYSPIVATDTARPSGSVPATYEIDWSADGVPCLPPAAVR
jgi:hypothetical protein